MFNRNALITGGSMTYVAGHLYHHTNEASKSPSGFQLLCDRVTASALHTSGEVSEQPKCHPGTRVAILNELNSWGAALVYEYPVKWLHGPAGAGKSAIQRTVAHFLQDQGLLLASFFFFRADPNRNTSANFIATIAYQMALAIPQTRVHIEEAIEKHPFIFSSSIWRQAQYLIIEPLLLVQQESPFDIGSYPRIIIVDGLDECTDPDKQCDILQALCRIIQEIPIPVALLVASRPEHHIRSAFDVGHLNKLSSRIILDNSYDPDSDIKKYLYEKFYFIRDRHPMKSSLLNLQWPSPQTIDNLVAKASGQFIYASTVEKFINSPRHNPSKRLDIILGALDAGDRRVRIRSPAHLERLFQLEHGDVPRLLYDLESLLNVEGRDQDIRIFHASLSDYLFDRSRSGQFWIDTESTYADLAEQYINRLPEWSDIHHLFMNNADLFLSKAAATPGLQLAIQNCNFKKLISLRNPYPFGLNYIAPTLLDVVIENSQFANANDVFAVPISAYRHLVEAVIQVYFYNVRLKAFLVVINMPFPWVSRKRNHVFQLSREDIETEQKLGFNFSNSVEVPPLLGHVASLLDDPKKRSFVDKDQYADIAVHGLDNLRRYSGSSASEIFSRLLPKSSIRDDLTESIRNFSCDCPHLISPALQEAMEAYNARLPAQSMIESESYGDRENPDLGIDTGFYHSNLDAMPAVTILGLFKKEEVTYTQEKSGVKIEHAKDQEGHGQGCCSCI
ncbi:hypothetical protein CPB84DRAFT_1750722 [Gymnopilus junonius]|uniref:Nephrocystin 3-like N-terminal domain-containing protein n=1 Tax=Gymnopilus junonius TaxID=109634 RepID=A0A9P5THY4_GYMJU|nr:hypothetical protein CPB84DRAFT_1750722 [Gymnopilus junonius]